MNWIVDLLDISDIENLKSVFPVISFLRPHLTQDEFIQRIERQRKEGYRIVVIHESETVIAAAGFRIQHSLVWGKVLYIDDLITHPDRKKQGLASALLAWLDAEAKRESCDQLDLDTGYNRHDAHRLYLHRGYSMVCHHMAKPVLLDEE